MTARTLTHAGLTLTISDWAKRIGQTPQFINSRLRKGWTVEEALTVSKRTYTTKAMRKKYLETEFFKMVATIDGALQVFHKRAGSYAFEEIDTPGVPKPPQIDRRDRCPRVTQDRA
ncbi:hypothetical protein KUL72_19930 [Bradyrhizobium arachidis]|uniref:hypothetical protein n=1 Tax=Bradyrhizobium arachidis TaxID=858423 RepID=UPI0021616040|nr:hypothetical protein [Bradyrhizobium arachidis]UVO33793.1 hypothetical protein KUL72_19930 [Bradyrhizobium arachidis]